MKIMYIVSVFPGTSTTFILNEMIKLRESGYELEVISLRKPKKEISQNGSEIFKNIYYVPHIKNKKSELLGLIRGNINCFIKHPLKYLKESFKVAFEMKMALYYDFARAACIVSSSDFNKISHIHAQFAHSPTTVAYYVNKLTNMKYSFTSHAVDIFTKESFLLERKLLNSDFSVTISEFNRNYINNMLNNKRLASKLYVIRCGIDISKFKRTVSENERRKDRKIKIMSVGRFVEKKGFTYLISAIKELVDRKLEVTCTIIGGGPLYNEIKDQVNILNLSDYINMPGAQSSEEVRMQLEDSDIFVLPCVTANNGDMDGIPVSLMEAMALEIPVISTKVSGIPELIIDEENGLLVAEKSASELANAIYKMVMDEKLRKDYGTKGRQIVMEKYDINDNGRQLVELFKEKIK